MFYWLGRLLLLVLVASQADAAAPVCKRSFRGFMAAEASAKPNPNKVLVEQITQLNILEARIRQRLYPFDNPFAGRGDQAQVDRIYDILSHQKDPQTGKVVLSPAGRARKATQDLALRKAAELDASLMSDLVESATKISGDEHANQTDLYRALLGIELGKSYAQRFVVPEEVVDRDGKKETKPEEKKKEEKQQKKEEDKKDDQEQDSPDDYPELPKEYRPHTKDTEKGKGKGKQKRHLVAETNVDIAYFKQANFNLVNRAAQNQFREVEIPYYTPKIPPNFSTGKTLKVHTKGNKKVSLYAVPGYEILAPKDPRVKLTLNTAGSYILETDLAEVTLDVRPLTGDSLTPPAFEFLTTPVGFRPEEWPTEVRSELIERPAGNPLKQAEVIQDFLRTRYLYSVGEKNHADPIAAIKDGAFQCDMAAMLMVGLLRDVFKIPSRAVGGFRAKAYNDGRPGSFLMTPGEAHAWVEVWHEGRWHTFDPTPRKKDKKDKKEDGEADDMKDKTIFPDDPPEEDSAASDKPSQDSSDQNKKGQQQKKDQRKVMEENTKKRQDEHQKSQGKEKGEGGQAGKDSQPGQDGKSNGEAQGKGKGKEQGKTDKKSEEQGELDDDISKLLEIGSLELNKTNQKGNPVLNRALRVLIREATRPDLDAAECLRRLQQIAKPIREHGTPQLKQHFNEAVRANEKAMPGFEKAIEALRLSVRELNPNQSYQKLLRIEQRLEQYAAALDRGSGPARPHALLAKVREIKALFQGLAHPDGKDIAMVDAFWKRLPPITQQALRDKFGIDQPGPNAATKNLASALKSGKLEDFALIAQVSDMTEFILDSTSVPEYIQAMTWTRDRRWVRGGEFSEVERPSEINRGIRMGPGSNRDNYLNGTLYSPIKRERIRLPRGYGETDPKRISIVGYDTSGSMSGEPGDFQAALLAAFADRALSDMSPSGQHRHQMVAMGFDTSVHTIHEVLDTAAAKEVIFKYREKLKNSGGGTDIMAMLEQAFASIEDAQKRTDEPLANANIIIMTDGQANISVERLRELRNKVHRETKVQLMFVAINGTNPELLQFANESTSNAGMDAGFYREFTAEQIREVIGESKKVPTPDADHAFYTEKSATSLPPSLEAKLWDLDKEAREYLGEIFRHSHHKPVQSWHETAYRIPIPPDNFVPKRDLKIWLEHLRGVTYQARALHQDEFRKPLVEDLMTHFAKITGIDLTALSGKELEEVKHWIEEIGDIRK